MLYDFTKYGVKLNITHIPNIQHIDFDIYDTNKQKNKYCIVQLYLFLLVLTFVYGLAIAYYVLD